MNRSGKERTVLSIFGLISIAAVLLVLFIRATEEPNTVETSFERGKYLVTSVPIPDDLEFAGERVPLENFDVRESLDQELLINSYWQSHTMLLIKRANRHFPVIEKILKEKGIPDDFKYLAVAESDLLNLVSPANAVGFWQIRKATGIELGLEVNDEVDERYHLKKATEAACKFLNHSYGLYNSWTMAAASYNMGRTGLNRQINRQDERYYYDLLLNEETGRYVYRLLALKLIMENPEEYGFEYEKEELYPHIPSHEVSIDGAVEDFAEFAKGYGINYKVLKIFNPWLRDNKLTNSRGKTYNVSIPRKGYREYNLETMDAIPGEVGLKEDSLTVTEAPERED